MGNVLKYSQVRTRVYITLSQQQTDTGNLVFMEIKNISKQSLNIEPAELMERFKRGDESRATEGSGLGLAIAKDLMKLMGGWLDIGIDGDLFKAKIMLHGASEDDPIVADMEDMGDMPFMDNMEDLHDLHEQKTQKGPDIASDLNHMDRVHSIDDVEMEIDETAQSADTESIAAFAGTEPEDTSPLPSGASAVSEGNLQRLRQAGQGGTE